MFVEITDKKKNKNEMLCVSLKFLQTNSVNILFHALQITDVNGFECIEFKW